MQSFRPGIRGHFGFFFLIYCIVPNEMIAQSTSNKFITEFLWTYVNFTWPSPMEYQNAIYTKKYIPENNGMAGIKLYDNNLYIGLPRVLPGTPVTLGQVSTQTQDKRNPLLTPYPSWDMNVQTDCDTLQNVRTMEIDRSGIMWVLDGTRVNNLTSCPPKLVLLDLNSGGKVVHMYVFRNEICLTEGGYLNSVVVDESDGGYAYITDFSAIDPGLIVYSRKQRRAWKLRDRSMFAEKDAANYTVVGVKLTTLNPIDGIGLSPLPKTKNEERFVYFAALAAKPIYAISTSVLKDEEYTRTNQWRLDVRYVGRRKVPSDGLIIDNQGNMFFGMLGKYAVEKWNIYKKFSTAHPIDVNREELIWIDGFAMDDVGYLYVMANNVHFNSSGPVLNEDIKYRIMKLFTGNKNYMFPST